MGAVSEADTTIELNESDFTIVPAVFKADTPAISPSICSFTYCKLYNAENDSIHASNLMPQDGFIAHAKDSPYVFN